MTTKEFTWLDMKITACSCACHKVGLHVRHCIPCCNVCYKKYIVDGKLDEVMLDIALEEHYNWVKEEIRKRQQIDAEHPIR